MPGHGEVREWNTPIFLFLIHIRLIAEVVVTIRQLCEVAFVVLAIVLKGNFRVQSEKRWMEVSGIREIRQFRYK
jgi:hypothetical protein